MTKLKLGIVVCGITVVGALAFAPAASADTVTAQGVAHANQYRGGQASAGGIVYTVDVQVARDPAGEIVNVRGAGAISKLSKVAKLQVDSVTLGTATGAVLSNTTPVNSGTGPTAVSGTNWRAVAPGTCTSYHVRTNFSIRWSDGALSHVSVLSPFTQVCGPTSPPKYSNCAALNAKFPHGVGRPGAVDHTSGGSAPVTNYYVSSYVYNANHAQLDRDNDGIACEHL